MVLFDTLRYVGGFVWYEIVGPFLLARPPATLPPPSPHHSNQFSNAFANGSNQNCGNVITDRSTTRLHAPPGGQTSFSLGWGSEPAPAAVPSRRLKVRGYMCGRLAWAVGVGGWRGRSAWAVGVGGRRGRVACAGALPCPAMPCDVLPRFASFFVRLVFPILSRCHDQPVSHRYSLSHNHHNRRTP